MSPQTRPFVGSVRSLELGDHLEQARGRAGETSNHECSATAFDDEPACKDGTGLSAAGEIDMSNAPDLLNRAQLSLLLDAAVGV